MKASKPGQVDLIDVTDGTRLAPVHPGSVLRREYPEPLGVSVYGLAAALGVSSSRINEIIQERPAVTAETALRLCRFFGTSADFWLVLRAGYDPKVARHALADKIKAEVRPRAAGCHGQDGNQQSSKAAWQALDEAVRNRVL